MSANFPCTVCGATTWPRPDTSCPLCAEDAPATAARYFTDGYAFWKFAPGECPQLRLEGGAWQESGFVDITEFLACGGYDVQEITQEEGEL